MDHNIIIQNKNESFIKLRGEKSVLQEVQDYFTFFVPGYKFMPAYKSRLWDGKLRLLNLNTNELYRGLLPYLELFCEERGYTFHYEDSTITSTEQISEYQLNKFIEDLNIHSGKRKIDVRDYQQEAVLHALRFKRATLLSPTSSGKSLIIYLIIRYLNSYKFQEGKGLLLVPTTQLVEQMFSDFQDYSSNNGFDVENFAHRIYSGKEKTSGKGLYISTWQSVHNLPEDYFNQFDYIINDEVHLAKGNSITKIVSRCINSQYRIGLTGTLDGTKCFAKFSKVKTINGDKKICEIEVGDLVQTYNEKNNQLEYKPVLEKYNNGIVNKMLKITVNGKEIISTPDHLFFTLNRGWVKAKNLQLSDDLLFSE